MNSPVKKNKTLVWPNNARIAVVMTCLLENWSGDRGPPFSVQTTALKPGTHDRAAMTWGTLQAAAPACGGAPENPVGREPGVRRHSDANAQYDGGWRTARRSKNAEC